MKSELRASLSEAVASDRSVSYELADELVGTYLAWKSRLKRRRIEPWEDALTRRYVEGDWLFEGRPSVVFAGQGKGKSNFAAWVIEKVLETRPTWDVYTNVPFPWDEDGGGDPRAGPCKRLHPVSSLSEVLRGAATSVKGGRKPAVILDEFDQAVTSHNWQSEAAQSWQLLINIERHLRNRGPLLVYHAYRHIPVVLREGTMLKALLQVIVRKGRKSGRQGRWVIKRDQRGFMNVDPAVLPYLAYGLRGFNVDVDVQDLERHLSGSVQAVAGQVLGYLRRERESEQAAVNTEERRQSSPVCEICRRPFSRWDAVERHRRTVHERNAAS